MRLAVICAVLIVSVLKDGQAYSGTEEEESPSGIPWVAHLEYAGFSLLQAPSSADDAKGYQIRMVHGITAQPWQRLKVYGAWRFRETFAPGFSTPYREPLGLQGSITYELIPELLYGWLGVSWPLIHAEAAIGDTLAWDAFMAGHSVLPDPSLIDPASLQMGGLMRIQSQPTLFLAAFSFQQPASFTGLGDERFRPPWILRASLQCDMPLSEARQRLNFRGVYFGFEKSANGHQAHAEGPVVALRYSAAGLGIDGRWAAALGVIAKLRDANRRVMLDVAPVVTEDNDNFQRVHFDVARSFRRSILKFQWIVSDQNEILWNPSIGHIFVENTLDLRLVRRVFSGHGLDTKWSFMAGSDFSNAYYGIGGKIIFTFRHLGLEELIKGGGPP